MRKVKCGMDSAEICWGMVYKVRNASLVISMHTWEFCCTGIMLMFPRVSGRFSSSLGYCKEENKIKMSSASIFLPACVTSRFGRPYTWEWVVSSRLDWSRLQVSKSSRFCSPQLLVSVTSVKLMSSRFGNQLAIFLKFPVLWIHFLQDVTLILFLTVLWSVKPNPMVKKLTAYIPTNPSHHDPTPSDCMPSRCGSGRRNWLRAIFCVHTLNILDWLIDCLHDGLSPVTHLIM